MPIAGGVAGYPPIGGHPAVDGGLPVPAAAAVSGHPRMRGWPAPIALVVVGGLMLVPGHPRTRGWPAVRLLADCGGFSLLEVLVALGIFLVVSVGALGLLGAAAAGGFQETAAPALTAGRRAKDLTVAGVYLQSLNDYLSSLDDSVWEAVLAGWAPGAHEQAYCLTHTGAACGSGEPVPPAAWGAYPLPPSAPFQLPWTELRIAVTRLSWDCDTRRFAEAPVSAAPDELIRVRSILRWRIRDEVRALAPAGGGLERVLAHRPAVGVQEACP